VVGGNTKTTEMPVVFLLGFLVEGFSFSPTVRTGQCQNPRTKTKTFSFSFSSDDKERPQQGKKLRTHKKIKEKEKNHV
jgi:hypothetical protein